MTKYIFVGTEKDLLDNGFIYRPHYDNYAFVYHEEDYETKQGLYIQIDFKTKEVDIYIRSLFGHRNETFVKEGTYNIQVDLYPVYFKIINSLIEKNIIKEKEDEVRTLQ